MSIAIGMSFAVSFMMLTAIGVVLFLPMLAPRLIEGLTVDEWSLARPLMCTRNIAAVFAAFFGITDAPPGMFVMIVLVVPLAAIVAVVAASLLARATPGAAADGVT